MKKSTTKYTQVKKSPIDGHRGIFAKKDIRKGTRIIQYTGKLLTKEEADEVANSEEGKTGRFYIFTLNDKYDIDGQDGGNEAHLANHSCEPNCEAVNEDDEEVWIYALKGIKKGEELTYDYGLTEEMADPKLHPCYCKSPECRGLIIDKKEFSKYLRKNPSYKKKWERMQNAKEGKLGKKKVAKKKKK